MEPRFQTSFIPKAPVISTASSISEKKSGRANLLSIAATILFLAAIAAAAGLYFYQNLVEGQIAVADKSLSDARSAFEPDKISQLVDANSKIQAVKVLLGRHVAVSPILDLIGSLTVKNVTFSNFVFVPKDGVPTVSMDVEALSYNALANEQQFFSQAGSIKTSAFSNFSLADNGDVKANFFATLDPSITSYKNLILSSSATTAVATTTTP